MNTTLKHMDCRNFAAVDVAKGICHRTKEIVPADGDHCEHFTAIPKCKFCDHFSLASEHLGTCNAAMQKPMTYPDLIAVTCEMFSAVATK
jgi:4-hydroxyphenylacetate decarboxylase small subunit